MSKRQARDGRVSRALLTISSNKAREHVTKSGQCEMRMAEAKEHVRDMICSIIYNLDCFMHVINGRMAICLCMAIACRCRSLGQGGWCSLVAMDVALIALQCCEHPLAYIQV